MREALHESVGLYIERTFPDRLGQYVDMLAHHFGQTRRLDKQRTWFRAAADAAKAAFANEAAIGYYERLLPLQPEARPARCWPNSGPSGGSPAGGTRRSGPTGGRWRWPRAPAVATSSPPASGTSATCSSTPSRMPRR